MRIIARKTLQTFWTRYRQSEKHLRAWYHEARIARWKSLDDIRKQYPSAPEGRKAISYQQWRILEETGMRIASAPEVRFRFHPSPSS